MKLHRSVISTCVSALLVALASGPSFAVRARLPVGAGLGGARAAILAGWGRWSEVSAGTRQVRHAAARLATQGVQVQLARVLRASFLHDHLPIVAGVEVTVTATPRVGVVPGVGRGRATPGETEQNCRRKCGKEGTSRGHGTIRRFQA